MINLLPYKEKKVIHRVRNIRLLNTVLGAAVFLCVVLGALLSPSVFTLINRAEIYSNEIALLVQDKKIVDSVDAAALEQKSALLARKLAPPQTPSPLPFIDVPIIKAPTTIMIERVTVSEGGIVDVYGVAEARAALQSYVALLEADPLVERVDNPLSNIVRTTENKFRITIKFKTS